MTNRRPRWPYIAKRARLLLCCLGSGLAAMPAAAVEQGLRQAALFERHHAYDAARRQLRAVMRQTDDRDLAQDVALRVCALWHLQGEAPTARQCYVDLTNLLSAAEAVSCARYRAAALAVQLGQQEAGRDELVRLIDELPYTDGARRAFVMARSLHRQVGGSESELEFLTGVISRLAWVGERGALRHAGDHAGRRSRQLLAEAWVEAGRIRFVEQHDPQAALRLLQSALAAAQGTLWEDDALVWLARTERHLGHRRAALAAYRQIITNEQGSGSNDAPQMSNHYDAALFEIGQTLEEARRFADAQAAYAELFVRAPVSRLRDDAAFRIALLQAHRQHAVAPLRQFMRDFPDSAYVRQARQLRAEQLGEAAP